ncbi:MAG: coproporphyrinogen III oxidase [Alphaproteobacteria bacterium CG1_02_46_17]|nr:MAG: coproporphyrinogen III oxidase [Alphaproteobacteria bacterium CG1_02_46_17]
MSFGIYIHWPFCKSKCPYCDFNSHVHDKIDHAQWRDAYLKSLEYWYRQTSDRVVDTVFFGGGTPSLMEPETVKVILDFICCHWTVASDWEVTLEANPTSFEVSKFESFRAAGVNRVSIGVQSFNVDDLKFLGREHDSNQARFAIMQAARIFDRISFDLIYARPNQTVSAWREELSEALSIAETAGSSVGHLSLYQLTIEQGTPFYTRHARREFVIPEQDLAADLYDVTQDVLESAGYPAYEVSNHARVGQESRHNLIYWRYGDYLGIGPGAHGRVTLTGEKIATRDHRAPEIWLNRVTESGHGSHDFETVGSEARFQECLMMGLRLREGVPFERLSAAAGGEYSGFLDMEAVNHLIAGGILEDDKKSLRTTPQGFKCLNSVLGYLIARS